MLTSMVSKILFYLYIYLKTFYASLKMDIKVSIQTIIKVTLLTIAIVMFGPEVFILSPRELYALEGFIVSLL